MASWAVARRVEHYGGARRAGTAPAEAGTPVATTPAPVSVAGLVTVALGGTANSNGWNLHGGVEYELLGDMAKAINNGDGSKTIGSVGVGFSY